MSGVTTLFMTCIVVPTMLFIGAMIYSEYMLNRYK